MKKYTLFCLMGLLLPLLAIGQETKGIEGKWDLELQMNGRTFPSWLEVKHSGISTLVGHFVYLNGSARPISQVHFFDDGSFNFSIPPQWESGADLQISGRLEDGTLKGKLKYVDGKDYDFTGKRATYLPHFDTYKWGDKIALFNGKNLDGWHMDGETKQWKVEGGLLKSLSPGSNLISDQKFENFKVTVEFRIPEGSNSGIYLRGRYEVQVLDPMGDDQPSSVGFSGIYGFVTPNEVVAKKPGEWQTYEITLNSNRVSILANGKAVIVDQIIPGITGGALDSKEGEPGSFMIQGDHGSVEIRKFEVVPMIGQ